ncbi:MAG: FtsQ-type POTRA domain-containing protein [Acidobacteriia bacterium]|nr:FtsQ-type POTRA domain-containing protein [Terriglobia bacterium]
MILERGGPTAEPDRRYWRRRANREVRKTRRTRTLLHWTGIVGANLLFAAVLVYSGWQAADHLTTTPGLAVTHVEVDGASRTSPDAIRALLSPFVGRNLLALDLGEVAARAASHPWIRLAAVKRIVPHTLRVSVVERAPAALAVIRGLVHVVDDGGFVMGPAGPGFSLDQPVLTGLDRLDGSALANALAVGARAIARLRSASPSWEREVSELDLSRPDRIEVVTRKAGPRILLDSDRVERNLNDFLALRPEIERRLGPATVVDLRWSRRISVLPAAALSEAEAH